MLPQASVPATERASSPAHGFEHSHGQAMGVRMQASVGLRMQVSDVGAVDFIKF